MKYIIINKETGEFAHAQIARYMKREDAASIPYDFDNYEDAMNCLNKIIDYWYDYEVVEV